ncbi:hypothetical protein EVAR_13010_1 [Eumeta japonica]|uniref:Uncharacterized protein n=1 Tax=Eumeta variegata TaxID=151549 RepID=A0A4C1TWZ4_EUMVA|nr:hypothetical protein EVAR_13010_1 [Eumeta japonica]
MGHRNSHSPDEMQQRKLSLQFTFRATAPLIEEFMGREIDFIQSSDCLCSLQAADGRRRETRAASRRPAGGGGAPRARPPHLVQSVSAERRRRFVVYFECSRFRLRQHARDLSLCLPLRSVSSSSTGV